MEYSNTFLGAKAPLGLVSVSQSVPDKKVGNFEISQDLNTKLYTLISYSPLWTCARLRVTTARDGHLPSLGWSPTNLKLVTHQKELCYIFGIWHLDLNPKTKTR